MQNQTKAQESASIFQVIKAVLWSMIGVRGQKGYENDIAKIKPKQIIIAGIIGALLFIFTVLTFVNLAINHLS
ncbi:MAG: DUF2970 domain-containing protein [Betaproteobacteria bacterium]|jgi:hypothetical protein|nr:DUF2970 domain-containing protein [Betaproteobacteria bacterium]MCH9849534.1 DUF2970 domain-containing protein [Betaproteobacteria bacterium]